MIENSTAVEQQVPEFYFYEDSFSREGNEGNSMNYSTYNDDPSNSWFLQHSTISDPTYFLYTYSAMNDNEDFSLYYNYTGDGEITVCKLLYDYGQDTYYLSSPIIGMVDTVNKRIDFSSATYSKFVIRASETTRYAPVDLLLEVYGE